MRRHDFPNSRRLSRISRRPFPFPAVQESPRLLIRQAIELTIKLRYGPEFHRLFQHYNLIGLGYSENLVLLY